MLIPAITFISGFVSGIAADEGTRSYRAPEKVALRARAKRAREILKETRQAEGLAALRLAEKEMAAK